MITKIIAVILFLTVVPVFAQESEQVRQLEQDVYLLKNTVVEQGRRIEALEREVRSKSSTTVSNTPSTAQTRPAASAGQPWHDRNSWGRVKDGMSEAQVVSILGRPTSVKIIGGPFKTLFYSGEVSSSGSVSGNIQLRDDRVWQVNTPVF